MFIPLLAICYFSWFTKQGVAFGIIIGITAVNLQMELDKIYLDK